jgi:c-di-GMP-binding flagellar brake protein YcgR
MSGAPNAQRTPDTSAILREACARNVPLELHRVDTLVHHPVARGRLLEMGDDRLYIEDPQTIGRSVSISAGSPYAAYFQLSESIFSFRTTVLETGCTVRLNDRKLAVGLAIARPGEVTPGQRRQAFRTSLATQAPIGAWVHEAPVGMHQQAPINARWFRARVVDASAGGLCLLAEQFVARLALYDELFVSFTTPGDGRLFCFRAELRHARAAHEGEAQRLGLMFLPWPDQPGFNRMIEPFARYLVGLERTSRRSA